MKYTYCIKTGRGEITIFSNKKIAASSLINCVAHAFNIKTILNGYPGELLDSCESTRVTVSSKTILNPGFYKLDYVDPDYE